MRRLSLTAGLFAVACGLLANAAPARALSDQTWVSGTGTDAGTCNSGAPCRTFQYAFGQTNTRGVINVASSADFGPVALNRSVSIVSEGAEAGVFSAAGGAAIKVNGNNTEVLLSGLTIDLFGSNNSMGIIFTKGAALHLHRSTIRGTANGIRFAPNGGASELYVSDSLITNTVAEGIAVSPSAGANTKTVVSRSRIQNGGGFGIFFSGFTGPINATVSDSVIAGNSGSGILAAGNAGSPLNVMIDRTVLANNGGTGVDANSATIRIGDSTISGNNTGLATSNGGSIASYGTNKVNGNFPGGDGAPSTTVAYK